MENRVMIICEDKVIISENLLSVPSYTEIKSAFNGDIKRVLNSENGAEKTLKNFSSLYANSVNYKIYPFSKMKNIKKNKNDVTLYLLPIYNKVIMFNTTDYNLNVKFMCNNDGLFETRLQFKNVPPYKDSPMTGCESVTEKVYSREGYNEQVYAAGKLVGNLYKSVFKDDYKSEIYDKLIDILDAASNTSERETAKQICVRYEFEKTIHNTRKNVIKDKVYSIGKGCYLFNSITYTVDISDLESFLTYIKDASLTVKNKKVMEYLKSINIEIHEKKSYTNSNLEKVFFEPSEFSNDSMKKEFERLNLKPVKSNINFKYLSELIVSQISKYLQHRIYEVYFAEFV